MEMIFSDPNNFASNKISIKANVARANANSKKTRPL
jgi:hypothetical protein